MGLLLQGRPRAPEGTGQATARQRAILVSSLEREVFLQLEYVKCLYVAVTMQPDFID